jgi:hypothetical protein
MSEITDLAKTIKEENAKLQVVQEKMVSLQARMKYRLLKKR